MGKNPFINIKNKNMQQIEYIINKNISMEQELYSLYFLYINGTPPKADIKKCTGTLYEDKLDNQNTMAETDNYFNDATETEHDVINKLHYKYQ